MATATHTTVERREGTRDKNTFTEDVEGVLEAAKMLRQELRGNVRERVHERQHPVREGV